MYFKGQGVLENYKIAIKYFRLSAEQGNANGQTSMGYVYLNGYGVQQNYKTALKWNRLGAENESAIAQWNLSLMYENGLGVLQDNIYAHMWANISAFNGNDDGSKTRDRVAKNMTTADISQAQKLARECVAKNYKDC